MPEIDSLEKILKDGEAAHTKLIEANTEANAAAAAAIEAVPAAKAAATVKTPEAKVADATAEAAQTKALDALADDDEAEVKPDEKGVVTLPFKAFERRIARAGKAHLKAVFGTDDREAILKMKSDYEGLLAKQDEDRRSKLATEDRLKEDFAREKRRADTLENEKAERAEADEAERETKRVQTIATRHVKASAYDLAEYRFAKHIKRSNIEDMNDDEIDAWYKDFAEKNPDYAKAAAPEAKKVGVNVGAAPQNKPSPKGADQNAKTVAPNQQTSMTAKELADFKKQSGYTW